MSYDPDFGRRMLENFGRMSMQDIAQHPETAYLMLSLGGIPAGEYARDQIRGMLLEAHDLGRNDLAEYISEKSGVRLSGEPWPSPAIEIERPVAYHRFRDVISRAFSSATRLTYAAIL